MTTDQVPTAPSLAFAMCVEAGGFESMSIRCAQSLRKFGGRFANCKMYAVTPRLGAPLSNQTLRAFDDLAVEYLNVRPPNPYAWYPMMNKPLALLEVQKRTTAQQIAFIDSDMIVMAPPELLLLDNDTDLTACAPDKNIGSAGQEDENTPFWIALCQLLGTRFDELPWIYAHRDKVDIKLYINSGIFSFKQGGCFAQKYHEALKAVMDAKLASKVSNIYFHEQAVIGVMAVKEGLRLKPLPHEYNYAVGRKIMDKYEPLKVQRAVILHYHDMMWPENWDNLMSRLRVDRPEIQDWLASMGPLKLTGSTVQKMTGKILGRYRKRKMEAHKASCRVV
jgi:hypothetical protein